MNVRIFSTLFIFLAFNSLPHAKKYDLERQADYLVSTVLHNNEVVIKLVGDLRDEIYLEKVLELAKDHQVKGLPLANYTNTLDLYTEHDPDLIVTTVLYSWT